MRTIRLIIGVLALGAIMWSLSSCNNVVLHKQRPPSILYESKAGDKIITINPTGIVFVEDKDGHIKSIAR